MIEVEIKSLLGEVRAAEALRAALRERGASSGRSYKQLNHYFEGQDVVLLNDILGDLLSEETKAKIATISENNMKTSIRSRETEGEVRIVVKATLGDGTSANGIARIEVEEVLPLTLEELDGRLLAAGFTYQSKWSREREEYALNDVSVCLDKNAGYGYVAEFERVVGEDEDHTSVKDVLLGLMNEFSLSELPQDRLERMFSHYNQHWPEYYGTDRVFTIL
jgi:adenylate cyclase class IV